MNSKRKWTTLCGDPTCDSYGCSQEAIDAWNQARERDARLIVRSALGLPLDDEDQAASTRLEPNTAQPSAEPTTFGMGSTQQEARND